jgi:phosphate transport system substrate-binding protein
MIATVVALALLFGGSPLRSLADATLVIAGSTTLLPFLRDAADAYRADHPGVAVTVTGGGSHAALEMLAAGQIDMAASDYEATEGNLFAHRIAAIGFAFVTSASSGVTALSRRQLTDVLAGSLVDCKTIGGRDAPITVVERPAASGIRQLLATQVMGGRAFAERGPVDDGTSALIADVKAAPCAVGYATFAGVRDSGLTPIAIDGVAPTDENVAHGTYPFWAYEYVITNGPATPDQSRFLAYVQTNRALLAKYGYIAVQDIQRLPLGE